MKKKDTIKGKNNPTSQSQSQSKSKSPQVLDYIIWIFKNVIIGTIIYFIVVSTINSKERFPYYDWAYNTLMKGNYETIQQYDTLSLDQKWEAKLGYTGAYWIYIRNNTPEDAVILFPTHDIFMPEGKTTLFVGEPINKISISRFLHPRKVVQYNEIETNRYGKQLTHVAIANGWGYDYLEYPVANKIDNTVLPIKQTENTQTENQANTKQ
ncbi:MAG: hypothetical protein LBG80_13975 [Bacteroidales bacterium]|jgi:hypothetical protein|nr:hypothetical protein [Bacteroidales bacterium]